MTRVRRKIWDRKIWDRHFPTNARVLMTQLGDVNEDGAVDGGDLATLLSNRTIRGK